MKLDWKAALGLAITAAGKDRAGYPRLSEAVMELADRLANGPGVAFRYMKQNLILAESEALGPVLEREAYNMARCSRTGDAAEAGAAFREKRPPVFQSR